MGPSLEFQPKGVEEFQDGSAVGTKRGLILGPTLGVCQRLVDAAASTTGPFNDPSVDEEEEHGGPLVQRRSRPEVGAAQVVLEVQPGISSGLFEQGVPVLVVTMSGVVSQPPGPIASQLIDE